MPETTQGFETWAVVEVMGHQRLAGYVTEQAIAGAALLRVDVPATPADEQYGSEYPGTEAYTKLIGVQSIYALTPCSEEIARTAARTIERNNRSPFGIETRPAARRLLASVAADARLAEEEDDDDRPL